MGRFPKPCLRCGQLTTGDTLCATHRAEATTLHEARRTAVKKATGQYKGDYARKARGVRQSAVLCHICGDGYQPNNPWVADHLNPADPNSPLLPAHKLCNERRGNKPL